MPDRYVASWLLLPSIQSLLRLNFHLLLSPLTSDLIPRPSYLTSHSHTFDSLTSQLSPHSHLHLHLYFLILSLTSSYLVAAQGFDCCVRRSINTRRRHQGKSHTTAPHFIHFTHINHTSHNLNILHNRLLLRSQYCNWSSWPWNFSS